MSSERTTLKRALLWLIPIVTLLPLQRAALAQESAPEAAAEAAAEPAWSGEVGLSYLATGGNSDTETLGFDLGVARRPMPWGVEVLAHFNSVEQDGLKTAERYLAAVRGIRTLGKRWEAFVGLSAEKDEFAGFDLRSLVEAGAVYKALLGPRHLLDVDLALTWTDEDRVPPSIDKSFLGGLVGAGYVLQISDNASFSQELNYFANFDESSDWRADSLTAVTAALNQRLALRLSHEIRYRNKPIDLNDDTDTTTQVSLVLNL